jgi:hypothetical protein
MDGRGVSVAEQLAAAPRSSVEKLEDLLAQLGDAKADDQGQRLLLTTFRPLVPLLRSMGYIPSDPAELDHVLLVGARLALGLRSDSAWQPETIDDLFLGPQPAQDTPREASDAADPT